MANRPVRVLCTSENREPGWKWLAHAIPANEVQFDIFDFTRASRLERLIPRPNLPRYRLPWQAARAASRGGADALVSFGPTQTSLTELAARRYGERPPHLAFGFNYTTLPIGWRRQLAKAGLRTVDRYVVASTLERTLYSDYLDLDPKRFDVLLWGVGRPKLAADALPLMTGPYVSAIGGEGRDYGVLFDAARRTPGVQYVVVARPYSVEGLRVPDNVKLYVNATTDVCWNLLHHSRFTVLPLRDAAVPCGHVTLVMAMYLRKALIVTESQGVLDYASHERNALLVPPHDPGAMADAIVRLTEDPALAERLGTEGDRFASTHCSEASTIQYFRSWLASVGLLERPDGAAATI